VFSGLTQAWCPGAGSQCPLVQNYSSASETALMHYWLYYEDPFLVVHKAGVAFDKVIELKTSPSSARIAYFSSNLRKNIN